MKRLINRFVHRDPMRGCWFFRVLGKRVNIFTAVGCSEHDWQFGITKTVVSGSAVSSKLNANALIISVYRKAYVLTVG